MPEFKWETKKIEVKPPQLLTDLIKTWRSFSDPLKSFFNTIKPVLQAAKVFLSQETNPILLALTFTLDELLKFISQLKNSSVHMMIIGPSSTTNNNTLSKEGDFRQKPAGSISYKDLFGGFSNSDGSMWLLNTNTILDAYVDSFGDTGDLDRPPSDGAKQKIQITLTSAGVLEGTFFQINSAKNLKLYYVWFGRKGVKDSSGGEDQEPNILENPSGDDTTRGLSELIHVDTSVTGSQVLTLKLLGDRLTNALSNIPEMTILSSEEILTSFTSLGGPNEITHNYSIVIENASEGHTNNPSDGGDVIIHDATGNPAPNGGIYTKTFTPASVYNTDIEFNILVEGQDSVADDFFAGGVVLFFGILETSLFKKTTFATDAETAFKAFKDLIAILDFFINNPGLSDLKKEINDALNKVEYRKSAEPNDQPFPTVQTPSIPPDWKALVLFRDIIPVVGELLDDLTEDVTNIRNNLNSGGKEMINSLINYLQKQIDDIDRILGLIQTIDDFFDFLANLGSAEVSMLLVEPQDGGINKLKVAAGDRDLEDRPNEDLQYCFLMSFVGAGTGFSLLMNMLGLSDTIDYGRSDNVPFQDDSFRTLLEIDSPL